MYPPLPAASIRPAVGTVKKKRKKTLDNVGHRRAYIYSRRVVRTISCARRTIHTGVRMMVRSEKLAFLAVGFVFVVLFVGIPVLALEAAELARFLVLGAVFLAVYIPAVLLPILRKGGTSPGKPNPSLEQWAAAAQKVDAEATGLEQMDTKQLQICGTAMQAQTLARLEAGFRTLSTIGWVALAIFLALAANQVFTSLAR